MPEAFVLETLRTGPLAGRVAVVSGGGRGLGRSFCLALARQGASVVVNNRNRVVDADGHGPADHVADEITAAGGEVPLPDDPNLSPGQLEDLLARSHAGEPKEFRVSVDAFHDLMDGEAQ